MRGEGQPGFHPEQESESSQEKTINQHSSQPVKETGFTRRKFLRAMGIVAGAVALAPTEVFAEQESRETRKKKARRVCSEYITSRLPEHATEESFRIFVDRFRSDLKTLTESYWNTCGEYFERTPSEQDAVRQEVLAIYGSEGSKARELQLALDTAVFLDLNYTEMGETMRLYELLSDFDTHGLVYGYLRQNNLYDFRREFIAQGNEEDLRYRVHAQDFLPKASELTLLDIDPRQGQMENPFRYWPSQDQIAATVQTRPAWATQERQAAFKEILDNVRVRELMQQEDLTLAEAFSLIKAIVKYSEDFPEALQHKDQIAELLLSERSRFMRKTLLGPETESFIHFSYIEDPARTEKKGKQFRGRVFDEVAQVCRVPPERVFRADVQPNDEFLVLKLREKIWESRGQTLIVFNTHGTEGSLSVRENRLTDNELEEGIRIDVLAQTLLTRYGNDEAQDTLANVTIIVDACHSYDYARNLYNELQTHYKVRQSEVADSPSESYRNKFSVPFESVMLPTIISSTQEGSLGFSGPTNLEHTLENSLGAIIKEGKLKGDLLLRRVQSMHYPSADFSFFVGKHGKEMEIGSRDERGDSSKLG